MGWMRQWLQPHVLESSDGILTTAGICEGLVGAGVGVNVLLLAGVSGLVSGALALGAFEYSKAAAERDSQVAQLTSEQHQLETAPEAELEELTNLYEARGLSHHLAELVAVELTAHDALQAHAEVEHGITPATVTVPLREAAAAAAAFAGGAALPLLAMAFLPASSRGALTFVVVVVALALTGWIAALISNVRPVRAILRTASVGVVAMILTYVAGRVFHP